MDAAQLRLFQLPGVTGEAARHDVVRELPDFRRGEDVALAWPGLGLSPSAVHDLEVVVRDWAEVLRERGASAAVEQTAASARPSTAVLRRTAP